MKVGEVFRDLRTGPEMAVLPAGEFLMGSHERDEVSYLHERPQHCVRIPRPFAVAVCPITFEEWDMATGDGACPSVNDLGWGRGRMPVINVSWQDAKSYVSWLTKKTGHRYRLLSEAEWEYACRAGTTTAYSTGDTITTDQANYNGNEPYGIKGVYRARPTQVGSFSANAFGLYDMHGNVYEWVEDCWHPNYEDAPDDGSEWVAGDTNWRVIRGGAWFMTSPQLRSAARTQDKEDARQFTYGARVARDI